MKGSFRQTTLLTLGGVAISSLTLAAAALLDGKTFHGECVLKGKAAETPTPDDLVFKDGKFLSTACVKYGFKEAPYTAKTVGEAVAWESTTVSASEGTMTWKGTVKGDSGEATFIWTKAGQNPSEWNFKGKLKRK